MVKGGALHSKEVRADHKTSAISCHPSRKNLRDGQLQKILNAMVVISMKICKWAKGAQGSKGDKEKEEDANKILTVKEGTLMKRCAVAQ